MTFEVFGETQEKPIATIEAPSLDSAVKKFEDTLEIDYTWDEVKLEEYWDYEFRNNRGQSAYFRFKELSLPFIAVV